MFHISVKNNNNNKEPIHEAKTKAKEKIGIHQKKKKSEVI